MTRSPGLGIVFDIDGLADMFYGYAAYLLLFKTIIAADRQLLEGSRFRDGDTHATLSGTKREYVISIEVAAAAPLEHIRQLMSRLEHPGLRPVKERFLGQDVLQNEPLAVAAHINELGVMDWCEASFVRNAWLEANKVAQLTSGIQRDEEEGDPWEQRKPS